MRATLILSLLLSLSAVAAATTEDSWEGATVEIADLGGCTGCVGGITRAMKRIEGVVDALFEEGDTIRVTAEGGTWIDPAELRDIIRIRGYRAGAVVSICRGTLAKRATEVVFLPASAPEQSGLVVEDPDGLFSEDIATLAQFVSTETSPTPVLRAIGGSSATALSRASPP